MHQVLTTRQRRGTDAGSRRERPAEVKNKYANAERYITENRGDRNTIADLSYRDARGGSRASGGPSEAESSYSRGSDNGEIRLKVDTNAPLQLHLNGDLEGRKVQLMPADENGMAELVIGGGNGTEKSYFSDRSTYSQNRRAIMPDLSRDADPRRDAEEYSEKSSRTGRARRDTHTRDVRDDRRERRHPLRRS